MTTVGLAESVAQAGLHFNQKELDLHETKISNFRSRHFLIYGGITVTPSTETYSVANENGQIVIRLNRAVFDNKRIADLLGLIELEMIRQKSKLTTEQAENLASEINENVWGIVKEKFLV